MLIDYQKLADARSYYEKLGYKSIEVPWEVDRSTVEITLPKDRAACELVSGKCLVGSAEQSFIQIIKDNFFEPEKWFSGKYQAITPCFRDEPKYDALNRPHFLKLELFDNLNVLDLKSMVEQALGFFSQYLDCHVVKTSEGYDIVDTEHDIELGSYGIRRIHKYGIFLYGTGLAEPRLSTVLEMQDTEIAFLSFIGNDMINNPPIEVTEVEMDKIKALVAGVDTRDFQ